MIDNFEDYCLWVYVIVDDMWQEIAPYFSRPGPDPVCSDSELLTMALVTIECHYSNSFPATEHYLKVLGYRHFDAGIPPELFPRFGESLIETLRDYHGADWDEELERQWTEAFEKTTATMLQGYKQEFIF